MVKNPQAMQETRGQSPGWEDPLNEGMATHLPGESQPHGQRSPEGFKEEVSMTERLSMQAPYFLNINLITTRYKYNNKTYMSIYIYIYIYIYSFLY